MAQPNALYVVTARMPGVGLRTAHGREFLGFENEAGEAVEVLGQDASSLEALGPVATVCHGPVYSDQHVADLQAFLAVLARAVLRSANGVRPSTEARAVAARIYEQARARELQTRMGS